mmetsp:Transcript_14331/g.44798  ORF Transcript_14331/g.44798 Transcript_14331/m.44798 type:complete len:224 (+) Transcript_14331:288-959(+)
MACSRSSSLMTSGGARRMVSRCVGFVSTPRSRSRSHASYALTYGAPPTSTAAKSPRPRCAATNGGRPSCSAASASVTAMDASRASMPSPIVCERSTSFSSSSTRMAASATADASGEPPNVEPCSPGRMARMTDQSASTAETGITPPLSALPRMTTSARTPSASMASMCPVRPSPVCTSSATSSTLCRSHSSRAVLRYPSGGRRTPPSPRTGSTTKAAMRWPWR